MSFKWTGSGSGADLGTTLDGSAGNFPIGQYITFWNNFVWVGKNMKVLLTTILGCVGLTPTSLKVD